MVQNSQHGLAQKSLNVHSSIFNTLWVKRVQYVAEEILVYTFCCFTFDIFSTVSVVYSGIKIIATTSTSARLSEEAIGICP